MSFNILEYMLLQQTPLIHFQYNEPGACLRASVVKPKLDKFLIKMMDSKEFSHWFVGAKNPENAINKEEKDEIINNNNNNLKPAFDYKMRIVAQGEPIISDKKNKIHGLYFGNMGKNTPIKETVFYKDGLIILEIFSSSKDLLKIIDENIYAFFLTTNFGTRQNKGFGSFYPVKNITDKLPRIETILEKIKTLFKDDAYFMEYSDPIFKNRNAIYEVYHDRKRKKDLQKGKKDIGKYKIKRNYEIIMDDIKDLYSIMKSGINANGDYYRSFLFLYMHGIFSDNKIANEKAWMKKEGICPKKNKPQNAGKHEDDKFSNDQKEYRYVRSLLGVTDKFEYLKNPWDKEIISVKCVDLKDETPVIQRFPSPILFKIIGNYLIIIPTEPDKEIYKKEFAFTGIGGKPKKLMTPDSFNMKDFVEKFVQYINEDDEMVKIKNINDIKLLKEEKRIYFRKNGLIIKKAGDEQDA